MRDLRDGGRTLRRKTVLDKLANNVRPRASRFPNDPVDLVPLPIEQMEVAAYARRFWQRVDALPRLLVVSIVHRSSPTLLMRCGPSVRDRNNVVKLSPLSCLTRLSTFGIVIVSEGSDDARRERGNAMSTEKKTQAVEVVCCRNCFRQTEKKWVISGRYYCQDCYAARQPVRR